MVDTNKILGAVINDRYRAIELIGKGGSGYVYKATDVESNKTVALKILKDVMADDDESVIRFEKEVAVSAKLTNAHTVRVFEFGKTVEGYLLIAMEYLQGRPLADVVKEESPLSPRRAVNIVKQTLEALAEAHQLGIVHRDLKPDNIFLMDRDDGKDEIKVLDFGIAKFLHDDSVGDTLTRDGFVFGTPLYISPEQALGWAVTAASDIYSLGVVFFEMITGDPPFEAETPIGLGMKHIYEPPPLDRIKVDNSTDVGLKHLLSLMLEKRPERRPANATTALTLFENLEEITDTPFDISRAKAIPHDHGEDFGAPTVRAKPASESDIEEYIDQTALAEASRKAAQAVKEMPPLPEKEAIDAFMEGAQSKPEAEQATASTELPLSDPVKPKKKKRRRKKKRRKGENEPTTDITGEVTAKKEAKPVATASAKKKAPADRKSQSAGKTLPPEPAKAVAEPEPKQPEDAFSLFQDAPPGLSQPVMDYDDSLPEDDWRLPTRRRSNTSPVGAFAWVVLLLGILMAGFVLYALVKGDATSAAYSPPAMTAPSEFAPVPSSLTVFPQ